MQEREQGAPQQHPVGIVQVAVGLEEFPLLPGLRSRRLIVVNVHAGQDSASGTGH